MGARVLFLGTAGDAIIVGKQQRYSGGIILNINETQFHVDPGPGSLVQARHMNVNPRQTTAVFISGNDLFRANDVNAVISAMTHDGLDKRGVLVCPSSVKIEFLSASYGAYLEKTLTVDNANKVGINNVDIEVVKLHEDIKENCGFKFISNRFSIGYLPDTVYTKSLQDKFSDVDILIMHVEYPSGYEAPTMNVSQATELLKATQPQLAVMTGFGIKMLQTDPLYEARQMQRETGIQVIAAKDGMTINPVSFATAVRQSSLPSYS